MSQYVPCIQTHRLSSQYEPKLKFGHLETASCVGEPPECAITPDDGEALFELDRDGLKPESMSMNRG